MMMALKEHSESVNSVIVIPENHNIVSGSDDTTIKIWNY